MHKRMIGLVICTAAFAMSAAAQTVPAANVSPGMFGTNAGGSEQFYNFPWGIMIGDGGSDSLVPGIVYSLPGNGEAAAIGFDAWNCYWLCDDAPGDFVIGALTPHLDFSANFNNVQMTLTSAGNVGIGIKDPGAKLEVNGNVKLTASSGASITFQDGTTQSTAYTGVTCGGDYAESVDVTGKRTTYEPGDVLVVDPNAPGKFLKANQPYSTLVAGIYSTRPGTVGRRQTSAKSPDEVPMAMMGIVPTKVTAENGPIKTGDLLVASSIPGYAMKGTNRSRLTGAVLGKALASLDKGRGMIEVLVTLQ